MSSLVALPLSLILRVGSRAAGGELGERGEGGDGGGDFGGAAAGDDEEHGILLGGGGGDYYARGAAPTAAAPGAFEAAGPPVALLHALWGAPPVGGAGL